MKYILHIIGFLLLFFTWSNLQAQQDPQFSHFYFSKQYTNPAYAGVEGLTRATLIHRSQWLGYSGADGGGAPTTQLLSLTYPLKIGGSALVNSGIGLDLVHDQLGPQQNIQVKLSYAYHIAFSNGGTLSLGLAPGIYSQKIDQGKLRPIDQDDAVVNNLGTNQVKFDLGAGVWYNTKKYFAGVSLSHVNSPTFNYGGASDSKLSQHMYITGGYNLQLGPVIVLTPTTIIQTDFSETNFTYGVVGSYNNYKYWGGIMLRQSITAKPIDNSTKKWDNDDLTFMIGIGLLEQNKLRIGYAMDVVTSGVKAKDNTSHEIMLSYVLPFGGDVKPPPLRTPRYRHEN